MQESPDHRRVEDSSTGKEVRYCCPEYPDPIKEFPGEEDIRNTKLSAYPLPQPEYPKESIEALVIRLRVSPKQQGSNLILVGSHRSFQRHLKIWCPPRPQHLQNLPQVPIWDAFKPPQPLYNLNKHQKMRHKN